MDIIIPARDEVETIGPVIASLLAQDYTGRFRIILVDDNSTDGTAAAAGTAANLVVMSGQPKPAGWSGKLWALSQGIAASTAPVLLFADADIVHDPRHLASLVARLQQPRVDMVSEMVRLNCTSLAERALVPAFVYFFQMLYPFARVNDPRSGVAAAAGGTVLIRREALERIGGIASIRNALIDDVTLAKAVKDLRTALRCSHLPRSFRPRHLRAALSRVERSVADDRAHGVHSTSLLGVAVTADARRSHPRLARPRLGGSSSDTAGDAPPDSPHSGSRRSATCRPWRATGKARSWALALPLIASFYMAATLGSALNYWLGRGARWKNRAYGA